jgi:hypothetical protein
MDQVQNMTAEQWNRIPLKSLKNNMYFLVFFLPVEVIPHLAPYTLAAMVDTFYIFDWHCGQLMSITAEQIAVFTSGQRQSYQELLVIQTYRLITRIPVANGYLCIQNECSNIPPVQAPTYGPHSNSPTHVPTMHTPTVNGTGPRGADVGAVFAIILGIIAGIQGLMIGYYFYRKRRVAQYQPL